MSAAHAFNQQMKRRADVQPWVERVGGPSIAVTQTPRVEPPTLRLCRYGTITTFPVTLRAAMSFSACAVSASA